MSRTIPPNNLEAARNLPQLSAGQGIDSSSAGLALPLTPALREELLNPAAWREGLEKYALAMHLGVTLVDREGRQLGPCLNPQPLWSLLRARQPTEPGECPFALKMSCTCVADALKQRTAVRVKGRTGLVHFAVPLLLGGEGLGAILAGQVFDQYPEQLPLEQVAKMLGFSWAQVWEQARREHLVSSAALVVYEDLLTALAHTFLQVRYHTLLEATRLAQLQQADEILRKANDELERRVEERTAALKEAQAQALQTERLAAIGQIAAGLAHEGRNALQRSQACLSVLELRMKDQPEVLDLLARMQRAQDDLHRLYEGVREYAAPVQLELILCHLADVWREAWDDIGPSRSGRTAELREETGGIDLRCLASPFHLKQVFRNLLDNALSAVSDPVRITITCLPAEIEGGPAIQVVVRDNGPGFSPEQRHKLFEPFHTTKVHGTGLGLANCKRLVEAHGGWITVGPGPGAEFLITLPRRSA